MLTVASTILGLLPFVIVGKNEPFWYAFAVGTISGLMFSIIGLLIFFPLVFLKRVKTKKIKKMQ